MSVPKNQEFVLAARPKDATELENTWQLRDAAYPTLTDDGTVIYEALYLSVDPYLSGQIKQTAVAGPQGKQPPVGSPQYSHGVGKVLESRAKELPVGTIFTAVFAWTRYGIFKAKIPYKIIKTPNEPENVFDRLGYGSAIGALGGTGQTAYYGAFDVGKFTESDVLVVSGAAGATGSLVAQIAKNIIKCKKVIGIAGGEAKTKWLEELGIDAIDYKKFNTQKAIAEELKRIAGADPITAYFDNTGGFITDAVIDVIARHGRIIVCGQISQYHTKVEKVEDANTFPNYLARTIYAALTIQGFYVMDFVHKNETTFFVDVPKWIEEGKIKTQEHVVEGFDKLPQAYAQLFTGANIGKLVVKV